MKKIFTVCLITLLALSRTTAQIPPTYYIDSQAVNFTKVYLDVNNIKSLSVVKDAISVTTSGSIYITMKQPFVSFLTLANLTSNQQLSPSEHILYIIDDKLLKDTTGVRIDPTFLSQVSVFNMSDVNYIGDGSKDMKMLIVRTKTTPAPADGKGTIRIRGTVSTAFHPVPGS